MMGNPLWFVVLNDLIRPIKICYLVRIFTQKKSSIWTQWFAIFSNLTAKNLKFIDIYSAFALPSSIIFQMAGI